MAKDCVNLEKRSETRTTRKGLLAVIASALLLCLFALPMTVQADTYTLE